MLNSDPELFAFFSQNWNLISDIQNLNVYRRVIDNINTIPNREVNLEENKE